MIGRKGASNPRKGATRAQGQGATRVQGQNAQSVDGAKHVVAGHTVFQTEPAFKRYLKHHRESAVDALRRLARAPFVSCITTVCVALSLFLPCLAILLSASLQRALLEVKVEPTLSAYYQGSLDQPSLERIADSARKAFPVIQSASLTSPDQGLKALQAQGAAQDAAQDAKSGDQYAVLIDALGRNPLPWRVDFELARALSDGELAGLRHHLRGNSRLIKTHYDLLWRERLQNLRKGLSNLAIVLGVIFAIGTLAMFAAALRSLVQERHEEVRVLRLIGASQSYIRRPFLYAGGILGLISVAQVLLALLIVDGLALGYFEELLSSYQLEEGSSFELALLALSPRFALLLSAAGLIAGTTAAAIVVQRYLALPEA